MFLGWLKLFFHNRDRYFVTLLICVVPIATDAYIIITLQWKPRLHIFVFNKMTLLNHIYDFKLSDKSILILHCIFFSCLKTLFQ